VAPFAPTGAGGGIDGSRFHGFSVCRLRRPAAPPVATALRSSGAESNTPSSPILSRTLPHRH